nr:uncharacterized protein LOC126540860 [Dermacentor andersoni]
MLACRSDFEAQLVSFLSALGCLLLVCPSMIIGAVAKTTNFTAAGYTGGHVLRESEQADVLPYSLHYLVPVYASVMGLGAIASSVFSSVDASALSAASVFARNIYFNVLRPNDAGTPVGTPAGRSGSGPRADYAAQAVAAEAALSQTSRNSTSVTPRDSAVVLSRVTADPYAFLTELAEAAKQQTSSIAATAAAMVGVNDAHQELESAAETSRDASKLTNVTANPEVNPELSKTFSFAPKQPKADRSRSAGSLKKGTRMRRRSSRSTSSTSSKSKRQKQKA